jgi:hypothetical protein
MSKSSSDSGSAGSMSIPTPRSAVDGATAAAAYSGSCASDPTKPDGQTGARDAERGARRRVKRQDPPEESWRQSWPLRSRDARKLRRVPSDEAPPGSASARPRPRSCDTRRGAPDEPRAPAFSADPRGPMDLHRHSRRGSRRQIRNKLPRIAAF